MFILQTFIQPQKTNFIRLPMIPYNNYFSQALDYQNSSPILQTTSTQKKIIINKI